MKRGFLTTSKAKKQIEKAIPNKNLPSSGKDGQPAIFLPSHAPIAETGVPKGYNSTSNIDLTLHEVASSNLDYAPDSYIYTTVPPVVIGTRREDFPGGWAEAFVSGHVKRMIHNEPGFPRVPLTPTGGKKASYRISEAGQKGLGMFATRLIRAGDLILDERPMLFVPASSLGSQFSQSIAQFTTEEQRRIILHEHEKAVKIAFDRMLPQDQEAFMALANSHEHDGSGPLVGRIRTNGLGCGGLRDKDATGPLGAYSAICKDTTRINHSCIPNTTRHWNTSSFSIRTYAVCDIPPGTEITLAYCSPFDSAADRAKDLASYGITSCGCGPACDPKDERSKIGDARRAAFRNKPVVLFPGFAKSEPKDAWVQPAVKRLAELEEEGLVAMPLYQTTLYQLVNAYTTLMDVEKVLLYANKLKGVYKAQTEKDLSEVHLTEEGIRKSPSYMMGEMLKNAKGMPPVMMSFA